MHQSETEGQEPAIGMVVGPEIFGGDVHDGYGDADLNQIWRDANNLENCQRQGDGVGDGEGGDDLEQISKPFDEQQGEKKSNVIVAKENMLHAELEVLLQLVAQGRNATGVVKVVRFKSGKD